MLSRRNVIIAVAIALGGAAALLTTLFAHPGRSTHQKDNFIAVIDLLAIAFLSYQNHMLHREIRSLREDRNATAVTVVKLLSIIRNIA